MVFEAIFGLHTNMLKSVIYQVNQVVNLEKLAGVLSCKIRSLPITYLRLPLGEVSNLLESAMLLLKKRKKD